MAEWYEYYTQVHLALLALTRLRPTAFMDMLLWHNSLAIWTSFHACFVFIPHAYAQYCQQNELSHFQYWRNNFLGHYLSLLYLARRRAYMHSEWSLPASLMSLGMHIGWGWAVHGGWSMNTSYVHLPEKEWRKLWAIAACTHLLSGVVCHARPLLW